MRITRWLSLTRCRFFHWLDSWPTLPVTLGKFSHSDGMSELNLNETEISIGTRLSMVVVRNETNTFFCMSSIGWSIFALINHGARNLKLLSRMKTTMTRKAVVPRLRKARKTSIKVVLCSNLNVVFGTNLFLSWISIHCIRVSSKSSTSTSPLSNQRRKTRYGSVYYLMLSRLISALGRRRENPWAT